METDGIDKICEDLIGFNKSLDSQMELYQNKLAECKKMRENPGYVCQGILISKLNSKQRISKSPSGHERDFAYSLLFIVIGIGALVIGLIASSLGAGLLITPDTQTPAVEAAIASALAVYGAGIAILLFGADLYLKTKSDIKIEDFHKEIINRLEEIEMKNRNLIELQGSKEKI